MVWLKCPECKHEWNFEGKPRGLIHSVRCPNIKCRAWFRMSEKEYREWEKSNFTNQKEELKKVKTSIKDALIAKHLLKELKAKNKEEYRDNAECRSQILSSLKLFTREISEFFDLPEDKFMNILDDEKEFNNIVLKARMKTISFNILEEFCDLRENMVYALETPHSGLSVPERSMIREINKNINEYAPKIDRNSVCNIWNLSVPPLYDSLSVSERLKLSMKHIPSDRREKVWEGLQEKLPNYEMAFADFFGFAKKFGLHFDKEDGIKWINGLRIALRETFGSVKLLETFLENLLKNH